MTNEVKLAPTTPTRTMEDVRKDFNQLTFRAGVLQYEIVTKSKDLEMLNESIRALNMEASKIQAQAVLDQQKAQEAAPVAAPKLEGVE